MAENSKIEWCHHTANLWWGCTEVHAGCDNCYARVLSHRWGHELWGNDVPRRAIKSVWTDLAKYQVLAAAAKAMYYVFVGSMMDIFEKRMPLVDIKGNLIMLDDMDEVGMDTGDMRNQLFSNISKGLYPNLIFLFLTKRPSNINKYIPEAWKITPPYNVMFGTSPVDQKTADTLIPQLLQVSGRRFLSVEPMLGSIDLNRELGAYSPGNNSPLRSNWTQKIDWVICGGESGPKRRPFNTDWARDLRRQCQKSVIPFFMKQIDKVIPIPEDLLTREMPAA